MRDTNQIFRVKTENDEIKEAKLINIFSKNNVEYAVYSIDNDNDTANLYASRIITDEEGHSKLVDIESPSEKEEIIKYIKEILIKQEGCETNE